ncbi:MAG: hypothetical protein H0U27_14690 [Nitrosopumilus sp.]|nr:hypothetical protein [Nitrosopumilus sp.]
MAATNKTPPPPASCFTKLGRKAAVNMPNPPLHSQYGALQQEQRDEDEVTNALT